MSTRDRREDSAEWRLRVDLAAAFRLAAEFGWHEAVANHFSLAVSADGRRFLVSRVAAEEVATAVEVVLNWHAELEQ